MTLPFPSGSLPPLRVMGLMSGTSMDGIDGVLARLELAPTGLTWEVLERRSTTYPTNLRERLHQAIKPESSNVALLTQLHIELGRAYAALACDFQGRADLIALSGQTVYHIPHPDAARGWRTASTLQLGEASVVAEETGTPVLSDFRQSDMAAGGQGAPMVAFGDSWLYGAPGRARAVHNLGGISNLTYLPADGDGSGVFAFDTGPANCLIDEAAERLFGKSHDAGGKLAAAGRPDEAALSVLMRHPYLNEPPPKTTGREVFNLSELEIDLDISTLAPHDLLATLTAFTAESIAGAYRDYVLPKGLSEVLLAGGGARNPTLVAMIRDRLPTSVRTFEELGWVSSDREALAFAVMGYFGCHGLPNTLPGATGAAHPTISGKLSRPWRP